MAITRAQQAKQMLQEGGRIGLKAGAQFDTSLGGGAISPGTDISGRFRGGDSGGNRGGNKSKTKTIKTKKDIKTPSDFTKFDLKDLVNLKLMEEEDENMKLAKTYSTEDIEKLLGIKDQKTAEKFVEDPIIGGPEFIGDKSQANIMEKFRENLLEQETKFPGKDFDAQRSAAQTLGISPTNRSLIPSDFLDKPGEAATQMPFSTIAEEIEERYPMAEGGIMGGLADGQIDEMGRQMYGLGKLVKKFTRAVKKVVKSPIGKAALLYTGAGALGNLAGGSGLAGMFRGFTSPSSFLSGSKLSGIFSREGLKNIAFGKAASAGYAMPGQGIFTPGTSGLLGFGGKLSPLKAITAVSTVAGALTPEQEQEAQRVSDETGIDIAEIRANPEKYLAPRFRAGGGLMRLGYQEGGDAEPVAKKTMPLIDMDGKEKDYRETGGFVDMGRMEKADDVPARLSKNEFVFTADAVRNAGEGDIDKGAEVMYNMMKNLEAGGEVSEESQGLEGARRMFQTSQRLEEVL